MSNLDKFKNEILTLLLSSIIKNLEEKLKEKETEIAQIVSK